MKTKNILSTAIAAGLGLLLASSPAKALTYNDGDLLLGFRDSAGSTTSYVIDLGLATQFISGGIYATGSIVNLVQGNTGVAADLASIHGAGWASDPTLLFGVAGVQKTAGNGFGTNTLFASKAEATLGTQSTPWARQSLANQGTPAGKIQGTGQTYQSSPTATNNPFGALQASAPSTPNNWAYFMPNGSGTTATTAFGYFNGGIENNIESAGINGVIDLYQLNTGSGAGTLLGGFRLDPANNGNLQFSSDISQFVTPVPEPASVGVLTGALLGIIGLAQRRRGAKTVQA